VHALLSLQAAVLLVCTHPFSGSQVSSVQGLLSSQLGGVPGVQLPPWQLSVQALPQLVPLRTGLRLQPPRGSQVSVVQGLLSSQLRGVPATQPVAGLQVSMPLQTLLSSQFSGVPAAQPVAGRQTSSPLQALLSLQLTGVPVHVPLVQTSPVVQALPSLQVVPFSDVRLLMHPATGSQLSAVHGLLSLQFNGGPVTHPVARLQVVPAPASPPFSRVPAQLPFVHASFCVHALLSLHAVPFASGVPVHVPFWHTPFC